MQKYEIDTHILQPHYWTPTTARWRDECMASLEGHPINVHLLPGVAGDLSQARYLGYSKGTAPYVSFMDPDDIVLPGTYERALNIMRDVPDSVCGSYSNYYMLYEGVDEPPLLRQLDNRWSRMRMVQDMRLVHQVVVMRRDAVMHTYEHHRAAIPRIGNELFCLAVMMATKWDWVADNTPGYIWRVHPGGVHHAISGRASTLQFQQWALQQLNLPVWDYHQIVRYPHIS